MVGWLSSETLRCLCVSRCLMLVCSFLLLTVVMNIVCLVFLWLSVLLSSPWILC